MPLCPKRSKKRMIPSLHRASRRKSLHEQTLKINPPRRTRHTSIPHTYGIPPKQAPSPKRGQCNSTARGPACSKKTKRKNWPRGMNTTLREPRPGLVFTYVCMYVCMYVRINNPLLPPVVSECYTGGKTKYRYVEENFDLSLHRKLVLYLRDRTCWIFIVYFYFYYSWFVFGCFANTVSVCLRLLTLLMILLPGVPRRL